MKKVKLTNTQKKIEKSPDNYKKFVAKNVSLTPYDKTLLNYISMRIQEGTI